MVKVPGLEYSLVDKTSLDKEPNVNKGLRVGLSVRGVEVDTPTFNNGVVMDVEGIAHASCLVLLDLGDVLRLDGEHGMMRAFTSGVDVVPDFSTMSAAGATRPS
jgi:seryl-tRNA(Sec) selenium transferase